MWNALVKLDKTLEEGNSWRRHPASLDFLSNLSWISFLLSKPSAWLQDAIESVRNTSKQSTQTPSQAYASAEWIGRRLLFDQQFHTNPISASFDAFWIGSQHGRHPHSNWTCRTRIGVLASTVGQTTNRNRRTCSSSSGQEPYSTTVQLLPTIAIRSRPARGTDRSAKAVAAVDQQVERFESLSGRTGTRMDGKVVAQVGTECTPTIGQVDGGMLRQHPTTAWSVILFRFTFYW